MLTIPTHIVPGEFAEKLKAIATVGFDAIDLSVSDVAQFDGDLSALADHVDKAGLTIASLGAVPSAASAALINAKIEMAQSLSASVLILDIEGDVPTNLPSAEGVRLALRPTRATETAVLAFIAAQDDPQIGLALNAFEMLGDGSRPARLRDLDGASVFSCGPVGRAKHADVARTGHPQSGRFGACLGALWIRGALVCRGEPGRA